MKRVLLIEKPHLVRITEDSEIWVHMERENLCSTGRYLLASVECNYPLLYLGEGLQSKQVAEDPIVVVLLFSRWLCDTEIKM